MGYVPIIGVELSGQVLINFAVSLIIPNPSFHLHLTMLTLLSSLLMAPKLKEMDDVIQRIYKQLISSSAERRTLLVCKFTCFLALLFREVRWIWDFGIFPYMVLCCLLWYLIMLVRHQTTMIVFIHLLESLNLRHFHLKSFSSWC